MVMYLGNTFPCPSCDLPKGSSEAGHLVPFYLVLLRVGFTEPPESPPTLVSSYLTVSPLPGRTGSSGRFAFCGTFPGIAPAGRYPALYPMEFGLSSTPLSGRRDHLEVSIRKGLTA